MLGKLLLLQSRSISVGHHSPRLVATTARIARMRLGLTALRCRAPSTRRTPRYRRGFAAGDWSRSTVARIRSLSAVSSGLFLCRHLHKSNLGGLLEITLCSHFATVPGPVQLGQLREYRRGPKRRPWLQADRHPRHDWLPVEMLTVSIARLLENR